ncbi:MAG TPA: thioredoxin fold domain-containing protein [Alphaproteobacteria bacterium]|nr:thioredoxin fold domain-containing protein [Alphaproteobacteria bacterium]
MRAHIKFLAVLAAFAVALSAIADQTFQTLETDGHIYRNVTVTTVTATDIYFTYDGGMGNAKLKNLSPDLQERFHYDAGAAAAQEQQQARANANFLATQPPQWGTDLPAALNQARTDNKCVLMDFTGSDWCPWCMKLDQDVFSTTQFAGYANNNLELVRVDFPHNTPQSEDLKQANAELARRFNVNGYPTCILLDSSGKELGRQVGYAEGGPQAFIAKFESLSPIPVRTAATPTATPTTTATQAPSSRVAPVASLIANVVPKIEHSPNIMGAIAAGFVFLFVMLRKVVKARQNP